MSALLKANASISCGSFSFFFQAEDCIRALYVTGVQTCALPISLQQMAIVVGLFSAFLSNAILARVAGGAGAIFWFGVPTWRWMFWMEAGPAAAFLLGSITIPESPRYLVFVGKHE